MKILTDKSLDEAVKLCQENDHYRVLIATKYTEDHISLLEKLAQTGATVTRRLNHPWVKFSNNSIIDIVSVLGTARGYRADLVLCDADVYNDYDETKYVLAAMETKPREFRLKMERYENNEESDPFVIIDRTESTQYDDWTHSMYCNWMQNQGM